MKSKRRNEEDDIFNDEKSFIEYFNKSEIIPGTSPPEGGRFSIKKDIKKFFNKVSHDKALKTQLDKHRKKSEKYSKRRGIKRQKKPGTSTAHPTYDSRVEFSKLTESLRIDPVKRILPSVEEQGEISQNIGKKNEKYLYDEKLASAANESPVPQEPKKIKKVKPSSQPVEKLVPTKKRHLPKITRKQNPKQKHPKKSSSKRYKRTTRVIFDRIFSGINVEKKWSKRSKKEKLNELKKYKKQLEESIKLTNKKVAHLNKKIEKNLTELRNGIKVYRNNSLLSLGSYFRKFKVNKNLKLCSMINLEKTTKKLILKRIELIDLAEKEYSQSKKFPCYVTEGFFCSVEIMASMDKEIFKDTQKIKTLEALLPQMKTIYHIERKIKAKGRSKKEMKNSLIDLLENALDTYQKPLNDNDKEYEKILNNFNELMYQDDIQDQFNKIVRDVRTQEGQNIVNFLGAIENFGGIKKIPAFEITEYIQSFVDLIKRLYKFNKIDDQKMSSSRNTILITTNITDESSGNNQLSHNSIASNNVELSRSTSSESIDKITTNPITTTTSGMEQSSDNIEKPKINKKLLKEEQEKFRKMKEKERTRKLKQLSDRLFFSLIGYELLTNIYSEINIDQHNMFLRKKTLLRSLPPKSLSVDIKFLKKGTTSPREYFPFSKGIELFKNLEFCVTPNDMMYVIDCVSKSITLEASATCKENGRSWSFGADELLPIIIHVIVHSTSPYISSHLEYIHKFGTRKTPESTYYLTCFEGAVMYIQNISEGEIQKLLDDLEREKRSEVEFNAQFELEKEKLKKSNTEKKKGKLKIKNEKRGTYKKLLNYLKKE